MVFFSPLQVLNKFFLNPFIFVDSSKSRVQVLACLSSFTPQAATVCPCNKCMSCAIGSSNPCLLTLLAPTARPLQHCFDQSGYKFCTPSDMVPDHARPGRIFSGFSIYDPLPPVLVFSIMIICLNMGSSRLLSIASFFALKSLSGDGSDEGKAGNQGYV